MSASESLIKNAVNNWSPPWEVDRIEDVEVSDYPIDGKGSPYRVFVTYKDSTENRKYHRTFYATIKSDTYTRLIPACRGLTTTPTPPTP